MVTLSYFLMTLLGFSGLFLIGLILLQRGRGGGLAGAFGGMGGQSAFGTKAGDVFTRITIGVASAWILLCAGSVLALHYSTNVRYDKVDKAEPLAKAPAKDAEAPANAKDKDVKPPAGQPKKNAPAKGGKAAEKDLDDVPPPAAKPDEKPKADVEKPVDNPKTDVDEKAKDEAKPDVDADADKKRKGAEPEAKNPEAKSE